MRHICYMHSSRRAVMIIEEFCGQYSAKRETNPRECHRVRAGKAPCEAHNSNLTSLHGTPRGRALLKDVHPAVLETFYGCGSPLPEVLEGCTVLDLGSGSGRDCFIGENQSEKVMTDGDGCSKNRWDGVIIVVEVLVLFWVVTRRRGGGYSVSLSCLDASLQAGGSVGAGGGPGHDGQAAGDRQCACRLAHAGEGSVVRGRRGRKEGQMKGKSTQKARHIGRCQTMTSLSLCGCVCMGGCAAVRVLGTECALCGGADRGPQDRRHRGRKSFGIRCCSDVDSSGRVRYT